MRLVETDGKKRLHQVQLYLSVAEARELVAELEKLIANPEASEHRDQWSSTATPRHFHGTSSTVLLEHGQPVIAGDGPGIGAP